MSARELRAEPYPTFRGRAPRHGCQPCLRESRPRAASRRHYPRVRVALVGDTHSSRAVRPTGACRAPATNAACVCVFEATMARPPLCVTDRTRRGPLESREEQEFSPSPPAWAAMGGRQPLESRTARPVLRSNGHTSRHSQLQAPEFVGPSFAIDIKPDEYPRRSSAFRPRPRPCPSAGRREATPAPIPLTGASTLLRGRLRPLHS